MIVKPRGPARLELRMCGESMQEDAADGQYGERHSGIERQQRPNNVGDGATGEANKLENLTARPISRRSYPNPILRHESQSTNHKTTIAMKFDEIPAQPLSVVEQRTILRAMRESGGNKLVAARLLGIGRTTLYRRLKEYAQAGSWHEPKLR